MVKRYHNQDYPEKFRGNDKKRAIVFNRFHLAVSEEPSNQVREKKYISDMC